MAFNVCMTKIYLWDMANRQSRSCCKHTMVPSLRFTRVNSIGGNWDTSVSWLVLGYSKSSNSMGSGWRVSTVEVEFSILQSGLPCQVISWSSLLWFSMTSTLPLAMDSIRTQSTSEQVAMEILATGWWYETSSSMICDINQVCQLEWGLTRNTICSHNISEIRCALVWPLDLKEVDMMLND